MTAFRVILLIQGRRADVEILGAELRSKWVDVISLTYDEPFPDGQITWQNLFSPGSTWAEGRNELLSRAGLDYDYYIFCDDDVVFCRGTLEDFCEFLFYYRPYVAVPLADVISSTGRYRPGTSVQTPVAVDQIVQAYSAAAVEDQRVLPFTTKYDAFGWWIGCEINQYQILGCSEKRILQCNTVRVSNGRRTVSVSNSSAYATKSAGLGRTAGLRLAKKHIRSTLGPQLPYINSLFHPWWAPRVPLVTTDDSDLPPARKDARGWKLASLLRRKALIVWSTFLWRTYRKWFPELCRSGQFEELDSRPDTTEN